MAKRKPLILSLVGARPQFIKLAPLVRKLSGTFNHIIVHSGQHYDATMSSVFFRQLDIPKADYNLSVGSGRHGEMTARIMMRFEKLLLKLNADLVLVYGDTNSTSAGALTAAKLNIPVGHVEAGLRSYRMDMPEEINRRLTDHISTLLFCPTTQAIKNLKEEGIKKGVVHSGDLMYELIDIHKRKIISNRKAVEKYRLPQDRYYLVTVHRADHVDNRQNLEKIVDIILRLEAPVIFPVHPRTLKNLRKAGLLRKLTKSTNVILAQPLSYLDNLALIYYARAVLTDSGGVQKESVFLGTPCLTLREETEWVETLKWGNHLVGLSTGKINSRLRNIKKSKRSVSYRVKRKKPSEIITVILSDYLRGE